jgi:hypothetical protein
MSPFRQCPVVGPGPIAIKANYAACEICLVKQPVPRYSAHSRFVNWLRNCGGLRDLARRIAIELLVAVIIGALLGLLGPFETYSLGLGPRMAYWIFMIVAGLAIFGPTVTASEWLAAEVNLPGWAAGAVAIAVGSLPMTLLVAWLFTGFDLARALRSQGLPVLYGQVLLISILTYSVYRTMFRNDVVLSPEPKVLDPQPAPDPLLSVTRQQGEPAFSARLPTGFGPLLALSSEDHYVRAHSEASSTLILFRLRDAIAELDPELKGMQVHRSWWVAQQAVSGHKRSDRTLRLVLHNGLEVPVSRERIADLKASGWL